MKIKKLNKIPLILASIVLIVFTMQVISFASPLNKGIYEVKNHREGGSIFVDETGKIILKSEPNAKVGAIKDLFTNEISMLYRTYGKMYEYAEEQYKMDDHGYEDWVRKYDGLIPEKTEYYDLTGNNISLENEVIAIVGEKVILKNGNIINMLLNNKYHLEGIKNVSTNIEYYVKKFGDKVIVSETEKIKNEKNITIDEKWVAYVYDINLKLIKKLDGYRVPQGSDEFQKGEKKYINTQHLDKYAKDEYGYEDITATPKYLNEELELEQENTIEFLFFENNVDKLETTINDEEKKIILYDIDVKTCQRIEMGNKHYYYIHTNDSSHFIYNDKGNRVKSFPSLANESYNIMYTDENYIIIRDNISESISVYDDKFVLKTKLNYDKKLRVKRVLNGKYYLVGDKSLYNKEFAQVFNATGNIKTPFDKYIFVTGDNSQVYDVNLKKIKSFNEKVVNVDSILINDKEYFNISGKTFSNTLDSNFNVILSNHVGWSNDYVFGLQQIYKDGVSFKYDGKSKHIVVERGYNVEIYDLNFKKLEEVKREDNQRFEGFVVDEKGDEYIVIGNWDYVYYDSPGNYELYKVGTGYLLRDFYFIGDLTKDHFTFANGFYYGLMDYDLNILCQYSIFDKMDDDATYWDEWY